MQIGGIELVGQGVILFSFELCVRKHPDCHKEVCVYKCLEKLGPTGCGIYSVAVNICPEVSALYILLCMKGTEYIT